MKYLLVLLSLHFVYSNDSKRRMEALSLQLITDDSDLLSKNQLEAFKNLKRRESHRAFHENSLNAKIRSLLARKLSVDRIARKLDEAQKREKQRILRTNEELKIEPTDLQYRVANRENSNRDEIINKRESRNEKQDNRLLENQSIPPSSLREGHTSTYLNDFAKLFSNYQGHNSYHLADPIFTSLSDREAHSNSYINELVNLLANNRESYSNSYSNKHSTTRFQKKHSRFGEHDLKSLNDKKTTYENRDSTYEKREDRDATYEKRDERDATYEKRDDRDATYEKRDARDVTYKKQKNRDATYEKRDDREASYKKRDNRDAAYEKRNGRDASYKKRDDRDATYEKRDDRDVTYENRDDRDATYEKRNSRSTTNKKRVDRDANHGKRDDRDATYEKRDRSVSSRSKTEYQNYVSY